MKKIFAIMTILMFLIPVVSAFSFRELWNSLFTGTFLAVSQCSTDTDCCSLNPNKYNDCRSGVCYSRDSALSGYTYCAGGGGIVTTTTISGGGTPTTSGGSRTATTTTIGGGTVTTTTKTCFDYCYEKEYTTSLGDKVNYAWGSCEYSSKEGYVKADSNFECGLLKKCYCFGTRWSNGVSSSITGDTSYRVKVNPGGSVTTIDSGSTTVTSNLCQAKCFRMGYRKGACENTGLIGPISDWFTNDEYVGNKGEYGCSANQKCFCSDSFTAKEMDDYKDKWTNPDIKDNLFNETDVFKTLNCKADADCKQYNRCEPAELFGFIKYNKCTHYKCLPETLVSTPIGDISVNKVCRDRTINDYVNPLFILLSLVGAMFFYLGFVEYFGQYTILLSLVIGALLYWVFLIYSFWIAIIGLVVLAIKIWLPI